MTRKVQFYPEAPLLKYHQNISNSCCLSRLASSFHCIGENRVVPAHINRIEESLTIQKKYYKNRIHFANAIMKNRRKIKGEQNLIYNMTIWKRNDAFGILNYISEDVTLVQLMDSLGNVNHVISIVGNCIFYSNYKKALCLTQ